MIVVTGANGKLGARIVDRLLERVPAAQVGVSVRDVGAAAGLERRGVRVRAGDFTDPASLAGAFEGASQVLVVSASIREFDAAVAANTAAMDAAVRAGAERVVYTSHQASSSTSQFPPMHVHAASEAHLAALGVPSTSLRHGFYATGLGFALGDGPADGRLVTPADGPVSWTSHADLAEAAAAVLAEPGRFDGLTPPLTAAEAVDLDGVAALLTDITGRPVERVVVEDEEWVAAAVGRGVPEPLARFSLGMFRAARDGEFAAVDPTLAEVVGHRPLGVRSYLEGVVAAAR